MGVHVRLRVTRAMKWSHLSWNVTLVPTLRGWSPPQVWLVTAHLQRGPRRVEIPYSVHTHYASGTLLDASTVPLQHATCGCSFWMSNRIPCWHIHLVHVHDASVIRATCMQVGNLHPQWRLRNHPLYVDACKSPTVGIEPEKVHIPAMLPTILLTMLVCLVRLSDAAECATWGFAVSWCC